MYFSICIRCWSSSRPCLSYSFSFKILPELSQRYLPRMLSICDAAGALLSVVCYMYFPFDTLLEVSLTLPAICTFHLHTPLELSPTISATWFPFLLVLLERARSLSATCAPCLQVLQDLPPTSDHSCGRDEPDEQIEAHSQNL